MNPVRPLSQAKGKSNGAESLIKLISSMFYIGYSHFLPGTLASLAGFLAYVFFIRGNAVGHLGTVIFCTVIGFALSDKAEKLFQRKDARQIVIDDFNGMLIGMLFLPYNLKLAVIGFIVFRVMDGLKPYPIYKIDKWKGALGIMGDDILAGVYTNIILQIFWRLASG